MTQISVEKVDVNFECPACKRTETCNVDEAVYNGAPYCDDCQDSMDMVDCTIDI